MKAFLTTILLSTVYLSLFSQENCTNYPEENIFSNITATQSLDTINAYIDKNWFVILDVRTPSEYNSVHLEEGVNIDYNAPSFETELAALDREKVYLVHCASGGRSGQVYNQMQTLGFHRVYNMTGGLNSWNSSGFPTTTEVSAIGANCYSDISFSTVVVGNSETIELEMTNAGNDTLKIIDISDLSGTMFSTDFNTDISLFGSYDYTFNVTFTPEDAGDYDETFIITTNTGIVEFYLSGSSEWPTNIINNSIDDIFVYTDYCNKQINLQQQNTDLISYTLFDISGKSYKSGRYTSKTTISYSDLSDGIYILRISSEKDSKTVKLMLY